MPLQTYSGSCNCGKVRFEIGLDLEGGTFKCNCTICWKVRFWGAVVNPDTFRLLSGEKDLTVYGDRRRHYFCKYCGVKIFGRGADGVRMVISVASLDNLDVEAIVRAPVRYVDGRHDNFTAEPDFTAHL